MHWTLKLITLVVFGAYMYRDVRVALWEGTEEWHCSSRTCAQCNIDCKEAQYFWNYMFKNILKCFACFISINRDFYEVPRHIVDTFLHFCNWRALTIFGCFLWTWMKSVKHFATDLLFSKFYKRKCLSAAVRIATLCYSFLRQPW